jgi:FAD/FMN-containing dehydrogenase
LNEQEQAINSLVYDSVAKFKGSISAEHGVGSLKVEKLEHHKSPVALHMMRSIKQALDPANLMNPGRVIRG